MKNFETQQAATRAKVEERLANMTDAAKKADQHIQAILNDDSISRKTEQDELSSYMASLPTSVQGELQKLNEIE